MNTIVLDFSKIKTMYSLHAYLKDTLNLPEYYGFNMDALWDSLRGGFEEETTILLKNTSHMPTDMQPEVLIMIKVFEDLKKVGDIYDLIVVNDEGLNLSDYMI
jgi:ribonuclease inhibitor